MKKYWPIYALTFLLFIGCSKDNDDEIPVVPNEVTVQNFMWRAMNLWYFWQEDVPTLSDTRFATNTEFETYLAQYPDPEVFFESQLLYSEDRFSFLAEDYSDLVNSFAGISKTNGLEFGLVQAQNSNNVFGYVRYVLPNSDASSKAIQRGDIFLGVNGTRLTIDNYASLLYSNSDTYTLNMGTYTNGVLTENNVEVSLTKEANYQENPVFLTDVIEQGDHKIGYLVYNGFISNYDEELNDAFGTFKAAGVTDLVLDVRYNPGGSVNSSRLLASMIYGTDNSQLYIKQRWNSKIQAQLSAAQVEDYFTATTNDGSALNTLNLDKVYVLATRSSASASELLMNGLAPYINVIHIGNTTRGKNEFSITLVDLPSNSYIYNSNQESSINQENRWGLQPLVGRNENADGFFDYTTGLVPDIELNEDLSNLGVLGNPNEPLLARAIAEITGDGGKFTFNEAPFVIELNDSKHGNPIKNRMVLDKPIDFQ